MRSYLFWCAVCACIALLLYELKYNVQDAQTETHKLEAELIRERERLHMVELEWTRLSRPERVAALCEQHVHGLQPVQGLRVMQEQLALWHISHVSDLKESE